MITVPLFFAAVVGFGHAFEIDHLLAVSNLVTRRKTLWESLKDGVYWGLGHTSTILIIGVLMILAKLGISEQTFHLFEAGVGVMLVVLGIQRIRKTWEHEKWHAHQHQHPQTHGHRLAYGVGLVHGLAGSGALVLLVMTEIKETLPAVLYLLVFGMGSIAGMLLASGYLVCLFLKNWGVPGVGDLRSCLLCCV
jgi:hypothetical protein